MSSYKGFGFACSISEFIKLETDFIIGKLVTRASSRFFGPIEDKQVRVWQETVKWLKSTFKDIIHTNPTAEQWAICLEYEIPRRGSRIDAIVLSDSVLFVIEFKSGKADKSSIRQVEDYALELLEFHEDSHNRIIIPIVCAGREQISNSPYQQRTEARVKNVSVTNPTSLSESIAVLYRKYLSRNEDYLVHDKWLSAAYQPTPTIIEAAKALYAGHDVKEISCAQASEENPERTEGTITQIINVAIERKEKAICFITGVPGAGKTLAGLNLVHKLKMLKANPNATFLSGNGPLVKVLQSALIADLRQRSNLTTGEATREATTTITNVHKWLDEYFDRKPAQTPFENIIVFDEAQRAWNKEHSKRKFHRDFSEPEMMLRIMDRHSDWAVIVALIGGGQEINTGEAGLSEWGRALQDVCPNWKIAISPSLLTGDSSTAGGTLFDSIDFAIKERILLDRDLHLSISRRSYRGVKLTEWVESVLAGDSHQASLIFKDIPEYPIYLTRDLNVVRTWLRNKSRGLRQCGIIASSGAKRLRIHGLTVSEPIDAADWFLKPHDDVRSSNFLEIPATEFGIQGLELDWVGLAWGGDFRWDKNNGWKYMQFRGTKWQKVNAGDKRKYILNKYRVLLTRARQGLIIWVPNGDANDQTRNPSIYDPTYQYLKSCDIPIL